MTDWVSRLAPTRAACFGVGTWLQARDLASGNVVYREVLALADTMRGPHVVIGDGIGGFPDVIEGEEQDASS
jgi:hypothetical protein